MPSLSISGSTQIVLESLSADPQGSGHISVNRTVKSGKTTVWWNGTVEHPVSRIIKIDMVRVFIAPPILGGLIFHADMDYKFIFG